jgi:hypothetical protein
MCTIKRREEKREEKRREEKRRELHVDENILKAR